MQIPAYLTNLILEYESKISSISTLMKHFQSNNDVEIKHKLLLEVLMLIIHDLQINNKYLKDALKGS